MTFVDRGGETSLMVKYRGLGFTESKSSLRFIEVDLGCALMTNKYPDGIELHVVLTAWPRLSADARLMIAALAARLREPTRSRRTSRRRKSRNRS
jgi:hypothetical protein